MRCEHVVQLTSIYHESVQFMSTIGDTSQEQLIDVDTMVTRSLRNLDGMVCIRRPCVRVDAFGIISRPKTLPGP